MITDPILRAVALGVGLDLESVTDEHMHAVIDDRAYIEAQIDEAGEMVVRVVPVFS
jgi:predicted DsbA family dithiol-disulfide isomerase